MRPCSSSEDTGEAMPSWARLVATATIGRPLSAAACLAVSSVLPPPIPTTASKNPVRRRARRSVAASTVPPSTIQISAFSSCGRRISAISSPCPGPTATATWPPLEIRRSASSGARPATAPAPMSMIRGTPTIRVSSATPPPARGPGRPGRRPRPTRARRPTRRRRARRGRCTPGSRPRSRGRGRAARSPRARRPAPRPPRGSITVSPMYSPAAAAGSCALLMPRSSPSSPSSTFISSSPSVFASSSASTSSASPRPASSRSSTSGGWTVSPLHSSTPCAKCSRAHHSE